MTIDITVPKNLNEIIHVQNILSDCAYYRALEHEKIPSDFLKNMVSGLIFHNLTVITSFSILRYHSINYPNIIFDVIDKIIATELGADCLDHHLKQDGETHISMIMKLGSSLGIPYSYYNEDRDTCYRDYNEKFKKMITSTSLPYGLGALYADEVVTEPSLKFQYKAFRNFKNHHSQDLDLTFFEKHINEIEPCHITLTATLIDAVRVNNLSMEEFERGFIDFNHAHETRNLAHLEKLESLIVT